MTYTITIMRNEPNPKYDPAQANRQYSSYQEPPINTGVVLTMEVTPEQFDRIRAAALQEAAVNCHDQLLAALKYARRFLDAREHDTAYVDGAIAKAEAE